MPEDSPLPATRESHEVIPLADATRAALKEADYDPRIVDSVNALEKAGVSIPKDATPEYVKAAQFETHKGLRASQNEYERLMKSASKRRAILQRKVDAIEPEGDSEPSKQFTRLMADINKLNDDMNGYAKNQRDFAMALTENQKNMLDLYNKSKKPGPPESGGNRSWDPDAPQMNQTNLHVNVAPGSSVTIQPQE